MHMDEPLLRYLPGELRRIADVVGLEGALRIAAVFGGNMLYVPALEELQRLARDETIRRQFRSGATARTLAERFRLTERSIWRVLNRRMPRLKEELISLIESGATQEHPESPIKKGH